MAVRVASPPPAPVPATPRDRRGAGHRTCGDVAHGEQPHAGVAVHRPLEGLAVGLAAVVHEAGVVAFGAGVDDAVLQRATRFPAAVTAGGPHSFLEGVLPSQNHWTARAVLETMVSHVHSDRTPPIQARFCGSWRMGSGPSPGGLGRSQKPPTPAAGQQTREPDAKGQQQQHPKLRDRDRPDRKTGTGRRHDPEQEWDAHGPWQLRGCHQTLDSDFTV